MTPQHNLWLIDVWVGGAAKNLVHYGTFSNARRLSAGAPASASAPPAGTQGMHQDDFDGGEEFARGRALSWARLIKKV